MKSNNKELSQQLREELMRTLKARFEKNRVRHNEMEWAKVKAKLEYSAEKLQVLHEMERTGGEPDARLIPGRRINRKPARLIWLRKSVLSC